MNKVNEWQELSLKKDIEKIRKSIVDNQSVHHTIVLDLLVAVIAILVDKLLSPNDTERVWLFWVLGIICLIPSVWVLGRHIYLTIQKRQKKYTSYSTSDLIDSFDNEICYYVMMAETYSQMLNDLIAHDEHNKNVATFYYIESWYYVNKAKYKLYSMLYKTDSVFSSDIDTTVKKNLISISRLVNIVLIMEDIRTFCNKHIQDEKFTISDLSISDANLKYDSYYQDFIKEINENFDNIISIDFSCKERFITKKQT